MCLLALCWWEYCDKDKAIATSLLYTCEKISFTVEHSTVSVCCNTKVEGEGTGRTEGYNSKTTTRSRRLIYCNKYLQTFN